MKLNTSGGKRREGGGREGRSQFYSVAGRSLKRKRIEESFNGGETKKRSLTLEETANDTSPFGAYEPAPPSSEWA